MAKNRYIIMFPILYMLVSSCSMKENIQRDILVETSSTAVNIPIVTNITTATTLAEVNVAADLNSVISQSTGQFTAADLQSITITGFLLEIEKETALPGSGGETGEGEEEDLTNTFEAFDSITVHLKSQDGQLIEIGTINNNSFTSPLLVKVPTTNAGELKDVFQSGSFTFVITGLANNVTTKIITTNVYSQYKLRLAI